MSAGHGPQIVLFVNIERMSANHMKLIALIFETLRRMSSNVRSQLPSDRSNGKHYENVSQCRQPCALILSYWHI